MVRTMIMAVVIMAVAIWEVIWVEVIWEDFRHQERKKDHERLVIVDCCQRILWVVES